MSEGHSASTQRQRLLIAQTFRALAPDQAVALLTVDGSATSAAADLERMREIVRLHPDYPFSGARMLRDMLRTKGYRVGRRHVATLMRRMGN